ncbi:MAG: hypothetical protein QOH12_163 [Solirubrobacteraceae bacterium]|jgi:hypothetical protein|nr:hypothetical protein [Solirubrobacteraceae bacterium]
MPLFPREADEPDPVAADASPGVWLLAAAAGDGVALTQTYALGRKVVREAAERWPDWWDTEMVGPPYQEAELAPLELLDHGLRRLRLVRRRGALLLATVRGKALTTDEPALLRVLAADLGGGDRFGETIAGLVVDMLARDGACMHDQLDAAAWTLVARGGWRDGHGKLPARRDIDAVVSEILWRGTGYGLIERTFPGGRRSAHHGRFALTAAGRTATGPVDRELAMGDVCVFDAKLVGAGGVTVRFAVSAEQHLTVVHDVLNQAFGWDDDHLYAFWLDGRFWSREGAKFVRPGTSGTGNPTADVPLVELDLVVGAKIAYVFDFGDEWRVELRLRERTVADRAAYPRILQSRGKAPPQYPPTDQW